MTRLTIEQERSHAQACQLIDLARDLTEDERRFVLDHWRASCTTRSASDRAYFTPAGLARDMAVEIGGNRIVDLVAGIGRLAFHSRDLCSRWPHTGPEIVCIERNPDYVRVGRRVMPEAHWICADIMTIPHLREKLGQFDCAVANPPFGAIPRAVQNTSGYRGRRFEYHALALAAMIAHRAVFLIPQTSAPFRYSGASKYLPGTGDPEYRKFSSATGIQLSHSCGINTALYRDDWHDVVPNVEVVLADFTLRPAITLAVTDGDGQLTLLAS